jgi:hypothetical protein
MQRFALMVATTAALWTSAHADEAPAAAPLEERIAAATIAELKRTEIVKHKGPLLALHAGYHGDVAGLLEVRAGWGTGKTKESLLFSSTRLWRLEAAARGAYGREDPVAVSLLGGYSRVGLVGYAVSAGIDARVVGDGDHGVGPIVSLGLRFAQLGLHGNVWTHLGGDEADTGASIAIGYNLGDYTGAGEIAKKRAKARIEAELRERANR